MKKLILLLVCLTATAAMAAAPGVQHIIPGPGLDVPWTSDPNYVDSYGVLQYAFVNIVGGEALMSKYVDDSNVSQTFASSSEVS